MRVLDYKWVLFEFLPYEGQVLEEYLEKMSLKGWILESIFNRLLIFKKGEKKKRRYNIDINKEYEITEGKASDKTLEYREICKEAKWNFVCQYERLQIFYSEDENVIPIHTDEEEKNNIIKKSSLKYILYDLLIGFILLVNINNIIGYDTRASYLAENSSVLAIGVMMLYLIMVFINIIRSLIWRKNKNLIKPSYKIARFRGYVFNFIFLVLLFKLIESLLHVKANIKIIIIIGIVLVLVKVIYIAINEKIANEKVRTFIKNFAIISGIVCFIVSINIYYMNGEKPLNEERLPLNVTDFNDKINKEEGSYFTESESILAKSVHGNLQGEKMWLDYDIFEAKNDLAMKIRLNELRKEENELKDIGYKGYRELTFDFIKDMKVYFKGLGYILVGKNKVIEIDFSKINGEDVDNTEEFLNIAYKKLAG